ncbi:uncharacterized protein J4E88_001343 [Alternaria novae-zelandiae]|uniref:uncharacterized protein n=1 Tax=Alternaria novae-zelandiae TaxID=430562 RepID=UPI0020C47EE8|nr:uncharacterized protein J4E88_001343 [Alternaria novae-zelandiae]KAI4692972.1 hypothetical protein J4E88_001343 [Alternaria novae-zelandiae]
MEITSIEQRASKDPSIMYINGGYRNPAGEKLYTPTRSTQSAAGEGVFSVWDYSLFPGEEERQDYMRKIKTLIKDNPAFYEKPSAETFRNIESSLPYATGNFGIDLEILVAECRKEMGLPARLRAEAEGRQVLSDFYGPLTPAMRMQIVDRAKRLVALDARFLSQHYRTLLYSLGVNPSSRDLLPSDIMEPLRAANLAPPFDPRRGHVNGGIEDIIKVEQLEFHLRGYLRNMKYEAALKMPLDAAMEAISERKLAAVYFKKARARLLTQTHPQLFDTSVIDIAGEVTQVEARVVLCRFIKALQVDSEVGLRKHIFQDWHELLRRVGVNPTITGVDVGFLMGKIQHLYYSNKSFSGFSGAVEEMLRPWFVQQVSWEDLEERVRSFVQETPLRATGWSGRDRLAAMGLRWDATVALPSNNPSKQAGEKPLNRGVILDTLVAKELKSYYGSGTEEENHAIAKYLKETYSFDITHRPIQYEPAAPTYQSSSDEMQQALNAAPVTAREEAQSEQIFYTPDSISSSRRAGGSPKVRQIKADRSLKITRPTSEPRTKHEGKGKQRKGGQGSAEGRWGTYSFIEGRNE